MASPPALLAIARQLMAVLEVDAMIDVLRMSRFRAAAPAMALAEAGTLLSGVGAHDAALQLLTIAVAREPRHAASNFFCGTMQSFRGQYRRSFREGKSESGR